MIPACELRKLVELDPSTGKMTWKHRDASYFKNGFHENHGGKR